MNIREIMKEVEGMISDKECLELYDIAKDLYVEGDIIEIGSYRGKSTCCLAKGMENQNKTVFAIDPWENYKGVFGGEFSPIDYDKFINNVCKTGVYHKVFPIKKKSDEVEWNLPISILFIDGAHDYQSVKKDFLKWSKFVNVGGFIIFHDVSDNNGPGKVVKEFIIDNKKYKIINKIDSMLIIKKVM